VSGLTASCARDSKPTLSWCIEVAHDECWAGRNHHEARSNEPNGIRGCASARSAQSWSLFLSLTVCRTDAQRFIHERSPRRDSRSSSPTPWHLRSSTGLRPENRCPSLLVSERAIRDAHPGCTFLRLPGRRSVLRAIGNALRRSREGRPEASRRGASFCGPRRPPRPSLASRCKPIRQIRYSRAERIRGLFFLSTSWLKFHRSNFLHPCDPELASRSGFAALENTLSISVCSTKNTSSR
jgi:hypothetical protein